MYADTKGRLSRRALLTETLPYEVPIIFSNNAFFERLAKHSIQQDIAVAFAKLDARPSRFTKPYTYTIKKSADSVTPLSIIHPVIQAEAATFYENFAEVMLACCRKSSFSIRTPTGVSNKFAEKLSQSSNSAREGFVEANEGNVAASVISDPFGEIDQPDSDATLLQPPIIGSYFAYSGYSLIGRFFDSVEYIRLEKRFSVMRRLDISRCFASIYTHSVAWAVKDRDFAKKTINYFSFESAFDSLMQRTNWGETNGIVIGPEMSRIFAEIILQDVDAAVAKDLETRGWRQGWDYEIRRYVDDYFVFANSADRIEMITSMLRGKLEQFKLYLNEAKIEDLRRPFVTDLTLARRDIRVEFRNISSAIRSLREENDVKEYRYRARGISETAANIRLLVAKYDVHVAAVSGWVLGSARAAIRDILKLMTEERNRNAEIEAEDELTLILISLLQMTFYMCFLDTRVRPTYTLTQIVDLILSSVSDLGQHNSDQVRHVMTEELVSLVRRTAIEKDDALFRGEDCIELYNLLICGAHFIGEDFLCSATVRDVFTKLLQHNPVRYFRFTTLRFCLSRSIHFGSECASLDERVHDHLAGLDLEIFRTDSEAYMMLCDYLTASGVAEGSRRKLFDRIFGGQLSRVTFGRISRAIGFVDWSGREIRHLLSRRELLPVYE